MMDFGATQCTPSSPHCLKCPLQETCVAFRTDRVAALPVKLKTLKVKERHLAYIYIRCHGETAIHRRPAGDIWQGLYEPLNLDLGAMPPAKFQGRRIATRVKHVLTHRVLYADFWLWEVDERPALPEGYFWIKEEDIDRYAVPRLVELLLEAVNG